MEEKKMTYSEAIAELEKIVAEMQSENCSIDNLSAYTSRSLELLNLQCRRCRFDPWVGRIPWRREWPPTPVFLPGESPWLEELGGIQSAGS